MKEEIMKGLEQLHSLDAEFLKDYLILISIVIGVLGPLIAFVMWRDGKFKYQRRLFEKEGFKFIDSQGLYYNFKKEHKGYYLYLVYFVENKNWTLSVGGKRHGETSYDLAKGNYFKIHKIICTL